GTAMTRRFGHLALVLATGCLGPTCAQAAEAKAEKKSDALAKEVRPLLTKYCVSCHGEKKARAKLNLEALRGDGDFDAWKRVHDRLRSQQMPPPDRTQPSARERERLLAWIEAAFERHTLDGLPDPGPLRPRRLNARELRNSLRDLAVLKTGPRPRRAAYVPTK